MTTDGAENGKPLDAQETEKVAYARPDANAEISFGSSKENHVYKCKYIIPNASEIIYD